MKAAGVFTAAAILTAGCSYANGSTSLDTPVNACDASTACGGDGACVDGRCVATRFDLTGLIVEVRPHGGSFGASTSYVFDPALAGITLSSGGGAGAPFTARMSPTLPPSVAIRQGRVRVNPKTPLGDGCSIGADRAVPAQLTFYRVAPYAGLPFDRVTTSTNEARQIEVDLVPDTYDVYVQPLALPDCNGGLPFPPAYFPAQPITTGGALTWDLPVVGTLTGTITGLTGAALDNLALDLLEPGRGLPVSANASLTQPDPVVDAITIRAQITWPDAGSPILRLAPLVTAADASALATAYWKVVTFGGTQTDPIVGFDLDQLFSAPVKVDGTVLDLDGITGAAASLAIQSGSLLGSNANNAAFAVDGVPADKLGAFSFFLPRGNYTVRATPAGDLPAITDKALPIPEDTSCFCAQSIQLAEKAALDGKVTTPSGLRVAGAAVSVSPAQSAPRTYWNSIHTVAPIAPRAAGGTTDLGGEFSLRVDPGLADVVVQPPEGSGFPWFVQPQVAVGSATLGTIALTNPAVLAGVVRDPGGSPIGAAEVNAWLPVRDPAAPDDAPQTVIKVAATLTDASGSYTLLLPSSL